MQKDQQDVREVFDHAVKDLDKSPIKLLVRFLCHPYTIGLILSL